MYSYLTEKVILSPCKSRRTSPIDTVTIHVMDGDCTIERCGQLFSTLKRGCSSNYGIDSKGRIGCYVEEEYRSWCSSNSYNDNRAITIEMANYKPKEYGYPVTDVALNSLINLLVDVCKRHQIPKLVWSNKKEERVNHRNGCNMTVHRDYAAKACPGNYLMGKMQEIADRVNAQLAGSPYVYEGIDYSPVFDPKFYAEMYDDLKKAFGDNEYALFHHFIQYGMDEIRRGNLDFDPVKYYNLNEDLRNVYGDNYRGYYLHYLLFGKEEIEKGLRVAL